MRCVAPLDRRSVAEKQNVTRTLRQRARGTAAGSRDKRESSAYDVSALIDGDGRSSVSEDPKVGRSVENGNSVLPF